MQYSTYQFDELRQAPKQVFFPYRGRDYKVEYQAFCLPENQGKTPVLFLGGAFQNFTSFRSEIELVLATHPIILADFPSQGCNDQLAPELGLGDFAHLIEQFCQSYQLHKLSILGISYGSAMAMIFAGAHPERMERLLLSGITCFRRPGIVLLYKDLLEQLAAQNMEAFATLAVCNLTNQTRMEECNISPSYRRMLYRQISRLSENEQQRYAQNTQRILDFPGFESYPTCPTLISTGEFDNFTQPIENAAVAKQCPNATFALVLGADHLAQYERKEAASTLFHNFMCDLPVDNIPGVQVLDAHSFVQDNNHLQETKRPLEQPFVLFDEASDKEHTVRIHSINFTELTLELLTPSFDLNESNRSLYLALPETGHRYHVRILEREQKTLNCVFVQRELKAADALLQYLNEYYLLVNQDGSLPNNQSKLA